jgi:predicted DCC family thiol-disulfide oxidoreductase YuxK
MGRASSLIVFIDGNCGFCQWASRRLRAISAEELAIHAQGTDLWLSQQANFPDVRWALATVQVVDAGRLYIKSEAVAKVLKHAKWPFQPLRLLFLLPIGLLDLVYDFIAKNRYFFGGNVACEINSQEGKV